MLKKQKINKSENRCKCKIKSKKKKLLVINTVGHCWNLNPDSAIKSFYIQVFDFAICTSAIRHLVCPLKFP